MNGKHGQETHSTKTGADKSAETNPNSPKFICSNCLPKVPSPKIWDFDERRLHWASVDRFKNVVHVLGKNFHKIFCSSSHQNFTVFPSPTLGLAKSCSYIWAISRGHSNHI